MKDSENVSHDVSNNRPGIARDMYPPKTPKMTFQRTGNILQTLNLAVRNRSVFSLKIMTAIIVCLLMSSAIFAQEKLFRVIDTGSDFTKIEFSLDDYEKLTEEVNGVSYLRIFHPEGGLRMDAGLPETVSFSTLLSVPLTGRVEIGSVHIEDSQTYKETDLFPSQGFNLEIDKKIGFVKDEAFYSKDTLYPFNNVEISQPVIMRDVRIISLTVNPVQYNPAAQELYIADRIRIRIDYDTSVEGENEIRANRNIISRSFLPIYENSLLNYEQFRNHHAEYQHRSILIVRHHSSAIDNIVAQFAGWKRDKGFVVNVVDTETASTALAIKNYIQRAYDEWDDPPEYVVIIGGGSGPLAVPFWFAHHGPGDHPYTLVSGDDDIADILVGRISVESAYELATVWNKIRNYERNPFINNSFNWHQNQLLVGDPRVSGISTINTNKYIKEIMNRRFDNYTYREHYEGNFPNHINQALNQGVGFFSFRGLELMGGWIPTYEGDYNNGAMTPNATLITCNTLDFNGGKQAEPFFRTGTPTTPRGCVSVIGMTTNYTLTSFNSCLAGGIYSGIIIDDVRTMGAALVSGKLYLWRVFGNLHSSQPPQYSHWANLVGDPSMDVWLQQPQPLNVTYSGTLPAGSNSISVLVTDENNNPLKNAWVTVRKEDNSVFATDYTDSEGRIVLFFDSETTGEIRLTVTKPDYIPYLGRFTCEGSGAVTYKDIITDESFNAGEQAGFSLLLKNYGEVIRRGVTGAISSENEYVTLINNQADFGDINPGGTQSNDLPLTIELSPAFPHSQNIMFDLTVTDDEQNSWLSRFQLRGNNALLMPVDIVFDEDTTNALLPGERSSLSITLKNQGSITARNLYGRLTTEDRGLTVIDSIAYFGDIAAGDSNATGENLFVIQPEESTIPGMIFRAELLLYNEYGFLQTEKIELPLGKVEITDPFGPDAYGYWVYDEGDVDYIDVPVYDWIEIAPEKGGFGINTGLESDYRDNQQVMYQELPFTFRYYGIEYDDISICSNGWISFGKTEQSTHKNWRLPGALGPPAMVAAFWDNLSLREGGVYTYYCDEDNLFVIQWQNALLIMQDAPQTFQIILYDPAHYPTITGDGGIKIQYKVFNNINNGSNTPAGFGNWGNYATIGIADHTCTTGLEYTFNNIYPTAAKPLGNETAIYFTTGYGTPLGTEENAGLPPSNYTKLHKAYPNPFNPQTTISFNLHGPAHVTLEIFNIAGRKVNSLIEEELTAGFHKRVWRGDNLNGNKVSSGIYFYRLTAGDYTETKKLIMLK